MQGSAGNRLVCQSVRMSHMGHAPLLDRLAPMGGSPPPSGRLPGPISFPDAATECGPTRWRGRSSQSEFDLLGDAESVINLDPEITDSALQLRMPEQQLNRSQIAGLTIDLGRLRAAHRVGAVS